MFTRVAVSLAVGLLGAYPFANATGMTKGVGIDRTPDGPLTVFCGIILFLATLGLIKPTIALVKDVVAALARTAERPGLWAALTMMISGAVCAIAAVLIQLRMTEMPRSGVTMNLGGLGGDARVGVQAAVGGLGLTILALLTFLLGASLVGLGVWASIPPSPSRKSIEPEIYGAPIGETA